MRIPGFPQALAPRWVPIAIGLSLLVLLALRTAEPPSSMEASRRFLPTTAATAARTTGAPVATAPPLPAPSARSPGPSPDAVPTPDVEEAPSPWPKVRWVDMKSAHAGWAWVDEPRGDLLGGSLLRTDDGGRCWTRVALPPPIAAPSEWPNEAFPLGARVVVVPDDDHHLFRTANGGRTWTRSSIDVPWRVTGTSIGNVSGPRATLLMECDHGMSSSCDFALRTNDGGRVWSGAESLPRHGGLIELDARHWFQNGHVATGLSSLLRTSDAGRSWEIADWTRGATRPRWSPFDAEEDMSGDGFVESVVYLANAKRTIAAVENATRLITLDDFGSRSTIVYQAAAQTTIRLLSTTENVAHAVLETPREDGLPSFLSSVDGSDWHERTPSLAAGAPGSIADLELEHVQFVSASVGFTLDEKRLWRTDDAGSTWAPVAPCASGSLQATATIQALDP